MERNFFPRSSKFATICSEHFSGYHIVAVLFFSADPQRGFQPKFWILKKKNDSSHIFTCCFQKAFEHMIVSRQTEKSVIKTWSLKCEWFWIVKKGTYEPTKKDFQPKFWILKKNNVVAEIFNVGLQNWIESNITSRQTQKSPEKT